MNIIIRKAQNGDEFGLLKLFDGLDQETSFMLMEAGERKTSLEEQAAIIKSFEKATTKVLLVAQNQDNGEIIGFLGGTGGTANRARHTLHIVVGVLKAYWGQSIGSQLVDALILWARKHQFKRIEFTVMVHNKRAQRFYEHKGFEVEGVRRQALKVDGVFVDEVYMACLL